MKKIIEVILIHFLIGMNNCLDKIESELTTETISSGRNNKAMLNTIEAVFTVSLMRSPSLNILDSASVSDSISVSETGKVVSVEVNIAILHTCKEELDVYLVSPDNTKVELEVHSLATCTRDIIKSYPPTTLDSLDRFIGKELNGIWTLEIKDNCDNDVGVLNWWSLTVQYLNNGLSTTKSITSVSTTTGAVFTVSLMRSPSLNIPDSASVSDSISVSESGKVVSVEVNITILHTCKEDLDVYLVSPDNTKVELEFHSSASCTRDIIKSYTPTSLDSLDRFKGNELNGIWTLEIKDNYDNGAGVLNWWTLLFEYNIGKSTTRSITTGSTLTTTSTGKPIGTYQCKIMFN